MILELLHGCIKMMVEKNERDKKAKEEMDKDMGDMKDNMRQMKGKEEEEIWVLLNSVFICLNLFVL